MYNCTVKELTLSSKLSVLLHPKTVQVEILFSRNLIKVLFATETFGEYMHESVVLPGYI